MEEKEIESIVKEKYPLFIDNLKNVSLKCYIISDEISKSKKEWVSNKDDRFSVFGRYLSIINSTKIALFQYINFINKEDWANDYKSIIIDSDTNFFNFELEYFKELDTRLRFSFYHGMYSQLESSLFSISRYYKKNNLPCSDKVKNIIVDNFKQKQYSDLIDILTLYRNSIHNNGIYFPVKEENYNKKCDYKDKFYIFTYGERVDLDWGEAMFLANEIIELSENLFLSDIINKDFIINDLK